MAKIEVKSVSKRFGPVMAVNDVTLTFEENRIYGLLGRNGAGKSTLLNMISNRIFPNQGEILIDGEPARENDRAQEKLYLMSEGNFYPDSMPVKKALYWTGQIYENFDIETALRLAKDFELDLGKKIKSLSTGYQSIFKLVIALSVNTPFVILDEPVLGLDANHRDLFYKRLIQRYEEHPCCYVISTHLIEEAARIIEHVIIIKDGAILASDISENLMSMGYTVSGTVEAVDRFVTGKKVIGEEQLGGLKSAYVMDRLDRSQAAEDVEITKLDLQKLFIQMTNS